MTIAWRELGRPSRPDFGHFGSQNTGRFWSTELCQLQPFPVLYSHTMQSPLYTILKLRAYDLLAAVASCDHEEAFAKGHRDGWEMLLDLHDGDEMAAFCAALPSYFEEEHAKVLLDGLAREYTSCDGWMAFVKRCAAEPNWRPSRD